MLIPSPSPAPPRHFTHRTLSSPTLPLPSHASSGSRSMSGSPPSASGDPEIDPYAPAWALQLVEEQLAMRKELGEMQRRLDNMERQARLEASWSVARLQNSHTKHNSDFLAPLALPYAPERKPFTLFPTRTGSGSGSGSGSGTPTTTMFNTFTPSPLANGYAFGCNGGEISGNGLETLTRSGLLDPHELFPMTLADLRELPESTAATLLAAYRVPFPHESTIDVRRALFAQFIGKDL